MKLKLPFGITARVKDPLSAGIVCVHTDKVFFHIGIGNAKSYGWGYRDDSAWYGMGGDYHSFSLGPLGLVCWGSDD